MRIPFALLLLTLAAGVSAQTRYLTAILNGDQQVPPVATNASGWALVVANDTSRAVQIFAHTANISAVAAHLHRAPAGSNGPVIVPLSGPASGPWTSAPTVLSNSDYAELLAGRTYVNVHTNANPGGEIRGQVGEPVTSEFTAALDASQQVPPNNSAATGTAYLVLHEPSNMLIYTVNSNVQGAVAAHIHDGGQGVNGPVLYPLNGAIGNYCGAVGPLTASDLSKLRSAGLYINIHSSNNPGGEIRGQIRASDGLAGMVADLDGNQQVPPVQTNGSGHACLVLNANGTVSCRAHVSGVPTATAAHVHVAPAGQNGPVFFGLTNVGNVWFGTSPALTNAQRMDALNGRWYVNVHTPANPGGEIRGQIRPAALAVRIGEGCAGSSGDSVDLAGQGPACPGNGYDFLVRRTVPVTVGAVLFGTAILATPLSLAPLQAPGCYLLVTPATISFPFRADARGCADLQLPLPNAAVLLGVRIPSQAAVLDGAANGLGVVTSNALLTTIE